MPDLNEIADRVVGRIKAHIAAAIGELAPRLEALEAREMPPGPPGERGADGAPGRDADPELVRLLVAEVLPGMVERAQTVLADRIDAGVAAIPSGKDGADGRDGADGKDGRDGVDGKSVTVEDVQPLLEAYFAKWVLDFERRAADVLQRAAERIPVPKDGVDGMSIEDLTVEHDGDGNVTLKFARGEVSREFTVRLGRFKDKGVFRESEAYREGDGVSFGGSFWIAQRDAPTGKPGDPDSGWRLAVKKGRDGKDGAAPAASRGPVRTG